MHSSTNVTYNLFAASYRGLVMPCVIKTKLLWGKTRMKAGVAKTKVKPQNRHLFSRTLIKLQQNKPILHCGWQPSQNKSCVFSHVCPLDKLIRLSPQCCFILDEFIILLPGKSTTISQANTICISHIYFLNKLLKL